MYPIHNFFQIKDYLPILNGSILAEIVILAIVFYTPFFQSGNLIRWYTNYRLSAVIADVLILMIGLIIARAIFTYYELEWNLLKFVIVVLIIQVIHDVLFYILFSSVPVGVNRMLDLFKKYAIEVKGGAILGDSFMIIIATVLSSFLAAYPTNTNIIILIVSVYLIPYLIHTQ
jgi:hypothetical protein